jgi:hypothetical protein
MARDRNLKKIRKRNQKGGMMMKLKIILESILMKMKSIKNKRQVDPSSLLLEGPCAF